MYGKSLFSKQPAVFFTFLLASYAVLGNNSTFHPDNISHFTSVIAACRTQTTLSGSAELGQGMHAV